MELIIGGDGLTRCGWGSEPELYRAYHDQEWGRPSTDDNHLFEKICLEGFQAGLSWLTILRKRSSFRLAFSRFDPSEVARYGDREVMRLLADPGIVRNEAKIRSTINNARCALDLIDETGSLSDYFWAWAQPDQPAPTEPVASTPASKQLSADLKRRGWSYVGPITIHAFMQSVGLVNDHMEGCHRRSACAEERAALLAARST